MDTVRPVPWEGEVPRVVRVGSRLYLRHFIVRRVAVHCRHGSLTLTKPLFTCTRKACMSKHTDDSELLVLDTPSLIVSDSEIDRNYKGAEFYFHYELSSGLKN